MPMEQLWVLFKKVDSAHATPKGQSFRRPPLRSGLLHDRPLGHSHTPSAHLRCPVLLTTKSVLFCSPRDTTNNWRREVFIRDSIVNAGIWRMFIWFA